MEALKTRALERRSRASLAVLALTSTLSAQQPNAAPARLTFDAHDGPPWPITNALLPSGALSLVRIAAAGSRPFAFGSSFTGLAAPGTPVAGGVLDLPLPGIAVWLNGFVNPAWSTNAAGEWLATVPVGAWAGAIGAACQAAVADPTSPAGWRLTAATQLVTTGATAVLPLAFVPAPASVYVDLTPYGLTLPFYSSSYGGLYVNSNGTVSFGSGSNDFTPTPAEFMSGSPRIAGTWSYLVPGAAGGVTVRVVQGTALPSVRIEFTGVAHWSGTSAHTFAIVLHALPAGDIEIVHAPSNGAASDTMLCGISPGGIGTFPPQQNLSTFNAAAFAGAPGAPILECFGLTSMPWYTAAVSNPWDLAGRTLRFQRTGAGAGIGYTLTVFP